MREIDSIGPLLPAIARQAIASWVSGAPAPAPDSARAAPRMPVFVTLRKADGALRGCVGALQAVESDVIAETRRSAVLAASRDPRFTPVEAAELGGLEIEVSVLLEPEPVTDVRDLDPSRYGLIVRGAAGQKALLLPEVPGIEDGRTQLRVTRQKAGLAEGEPSTFSRFEVKKFTEKA